MSTTFDQHYNQLFNNELHLEFARTGPQLREAVTVQNTTGNNRVYFKLIGSGVATTKARGAPATYMNLNRSRVYADPSDLYAVELISEADEIRTGSPSRAAVQQRCVEALGRGWDDEIITTLTGTSTTEIAAGGVAMTLQKILRTQEYFLDNNIPLSDVTMLIGSRQLSDMEQSIPEFKSFDYVARRAFDRPDLTSFMWKNLKWQVFNALPLTSTTRSCYAVSKRSVGAILPHEISTSGDRRVDLVNEWQISSWMSHGSVLIQPAGVIEIECVEA